MHHDGIPNILAKNLKRFRKALGITQEKMAEKANISSGFVKQIETCRTWIGPDTLDQLAQALGCQPWELLKKPGDEMSSVASPTTPYTASHGVSPQEIANLILAYCAAPVELRDSTRRQLSAAGRRQSTEELLRDLEAEAANLLPQPSPALKKTKS